MLQLPSNVNMSCCRWYQHYKQPVLFLCVTVRKWLLSPMSAEASVGSDAADSAPSDVSQPAFHSTEELRHRGLLGSKYVKLNVGGSLHYTTVQTLSKEDSLLRSICNGGTEVTIDSEGEWVLHWIHIFTVYCLRAVSFSRISYFIVISALVYIHFLQDCLHSLLFFRLNTVGLDAVYKMIWIGKACR